MATTTYLITGSNKGIGRAIVTSLLLRLSTTVVACVREPTDPTSASLLDLAKAEGSRLVLLQLRDPDHFDSLVSSLATESITHLDVVIANAGNSTSIHLGVLDTKPEHVLHDVTANSISVMRLFQATLPLITTENKDPSPGQSKFIYMTSTLGSIGTLDTEAMPGCIAYSMSKAAANWYVKRVSVEYKNITVGILHPGWVQTHMGQTLADAVNVSQPPATTEESARECLKEIDDWTPERSGHFRCHRHEEIPW